MPKVDVGIAMMSTRMQRVEKGITGKNRGPRSLAASEGFAVPSPTRADHRDAPQQPMAEEHPPSLRSGVDLLWREGAPQPPPGPRPKRKQFSRFVPSHNRGKPTSHETLDAIANEQAADVFNRAHYARPPARLAVRLSKDVLELCRQRGIQPNALMREGANPLADLVHTMHGPHTPSWEYALSDPTEAQFDDSAAAASTPRPHGAAGGRVDSLAAAAATRAMNSARSAPGSGRRKAQARTRAAGEDTAPSSARAARARPVLDEEEVAETQKRMQTEVEELRKKVRRFGGTNREEPRGPARNARGARGRGDPCVRARPMHAI